MNPKLANERIVKSDDSIRLNLLRYLPTILVLSLLFLMAVVFGRYIYAPCDDAYIFFVYARNFVEGNGLTYNGAVVEGFSSVLWVISLSVLGLTKVDLPVLAESLSVLTGLLAIFAAYLLAKSLSIDGRLALLPPILLVATGDFAFYMSVGLEQVLFTGLITLSVAQSYSKNPRKTLHSYHFPFLMAIMILARPEGALISALLLSILAIQSRSPLSAFRCAMLLALILVPVFVFKRTYYGYWLPNTYYAKSNVGLSNLDQGLKYLSMSSRRYGVLLISGIILAFWGFFREKLNAFRDLWPLALISAVWIINVAVQGGDNMVGGRVLIPILSLVYVALVKLATNTNLKPKALTALTIFVSFALIYGYLYDPDVADHADNWRMSFAERQNTGVYLRENFAPDTLVALNPAGIIPYFSQLPTIDMLGLNDTHIAHHGKRDSTLRYGHQAGDGLYVLSREPDIILLGAGRKNPGPNISDQEIWNSPQFQENYELQDWPTGTLAYVERK